MATLRVPKTPPPCVGAFSTINLKPPIVCAVCPGPIDHRHPVTVSKSGAPMHPGCWDETEGGKRPLRLPGLKPQDA